MQSKIKQKKCRVCGVIFYPRNLLQSVCSYDCAVKYTRGEKEKKWKKEKAEIKEKLKTYSDHLKELQVLFNTYIRLRDEGRECISCDNLLKGKYDAGHFFSVGAYPNLRFNENNVHGQCVHCNQHKHGNLIEYGIRLPERIGNEAYNELRLTRQQPLKLSIPEIQVLKIKYKERIKMLKDDKA